MSKIRYGKLVAFLLLVAMLFGVYCGTIFVIKNRKVSLSIGIVSNIEILEAYTRLCNEYDDLCSNETKEYYKDKIEKDFNLKFYFYREKELDNYGYTYCEIRKIEIDKRLSGYAYCRTFAHETIHLTYYISDERFVCYETFKYLYESEELHNVGVWYGLKQLNGDYSGEYDISGLVVNYLTNK